jgi:hypothetical protein
LSAAAYAHGKPGLWTVTTQLDFTKGGPQIPPEQLEKMKQMGIQLPFGKPVSHDVCITPEQAAQDEPPKPEQRGSCTMQNLKRDGHSFSGDMVCHGEMEGIGHMRLSYDSDEHYTGSMQFAGQGQREGAIEMNDQFSGQWKSADCGTVKPFAQK